MSLRIYKPQQTNWNHSFLQEYLKLFNVQNIRFGIHLHSMVKNFCLFTFHKFLKIFEQE